jgi:anti-sigma regulatory factor (Ser/Thr protein kinase)
VSEITDEGMGPRGFRHGACTYASPDDLVRTVGPFIEHGIQRGDAVLVAVPEASLSVLRPVFGAKVQFASMEEIGRNPAWIIPAWTDFLAEAAAGEQAARGVGEPVWVGRDADELVECEHHEALLDVAFADAPDFALLCPYDVGLGGVADRIGRSHPDCLDGHHLAPNGRRAADTADAGAGSLPSPPLGTPVLAFGPADVPAVRRHVVGVARTAGLAAPLVDDLAVAVSEAATNSVRHGGGSGEVAVWVRPGRPAVVCEVRDHGHITDPLAGRRRPTTDQPDGRGLWLMQRLCDLVQVRDVPGGQVIRLHMANR